MTQTSKVLCAECSYKTDGYHQYECLKQCAKDTLEILGYLEKENNDLFFKLQGVMWSVDKWLDGDELKQDEVNRAITMREKTLQITEKQQAEIERLREHLSIPSGEEDEDWYTMPQLKTLKKSKIEVIKDVLLTIEAEVESSNKYLREYDGSEVQKAYNKGLKDIYKIVKEMMEVSNE